MNFYLIKGKIEKQKINKEQKQRNSRHKYQGSVITLKRKWSKHYQSGFSRLIQSETESISIKTHFKELAPMIVRTGKFKISRAAWQPSKSGKS